MPNKINAYRKLDDVIRGLTESVRLPIEPPAQPKPVRNFSDIVDKWKANEGPSLGQTTFEHYCNALRAYVLPTWANRPVDSINREAIQSFLVAQANKYGKSSLKSMRLVVMMVLGWAEKNGDIDRPNGWLDGIRLPKKTGGRKIKRNVLGGGQVLAIMSRLREPYSTLVLFLALLGRRIEEAIGIKPDDLDDDNVLHIRRVVYNGRIEELEKEQELPLAEEHSELVVRLRRLGAGQQWVFRSKAGTLIDPGNARRRYLKPAAEAEGIDIGGWHDFRHTLATKLRQAGVHPKVISGVLGHKKVELAANVYDHCDSHEIRSALVLVGKQFHPHAFALGSRNLVANPFSGKLPFKLRERKQHVQSQSPHRRDGVELLGNRNK